MRSAFGIEHGEVAKGLPSAVKAGGGGTYGSLLRVKNKVGREGAKYSSVRHLNTGIGRQGKGVLADMRTSRNVDRSVAGKAAREHRAGLLNEDSAARRRGFKTGKSSALDRGYRGRVSNPMTKLP